LTFNSKKARKALQCQKKSAKSITMSEIDKSFGGSDLAAGFVPAKNDMG